MQALKLVVVGLGVLIVISIGLLGWGFYTKLKRSDSVAATGPATATSMPPLAGAAPAATAATAAFGEVRYPLPSGCTAVEMRPAGDRLYVRTGPTGLCERIIVFDAAGRLLGSIVLTP